MSAWPGVAPELEAADPTRAAASRKRRARLLAAIALVYLGRLVSAAVVSVPWVAAVSASGIGDFPEGDARLFEGGGLYLLEVVLEQRALLMALVLPTAAALLALSLAGIVPEWVLLRALRPAPLAPDALAVDASAGGGTKPPVSEARRALLQLLALGVAGWAARGLLVLVTAALATTARSYFVSARDERLPSLGAAVVLFVGLLGWACLTMLHDLAAIEVARGGASVRASLERALAALRRRGLGLAARYGLFGLASLGVLLAGAAAVSWLDVSRGGAWGPLAAGALHQAVILAQVGLHAAWLSSAMPSRSAREGGPPPPPRPRPHAEAFL